jgi:hypothetical protein
VDLRRANIGRGGLTRKWRTTRRCTRSRTTVRRGLSRPAGLRVLAAARAVGDGHRGGGERDHEGEEDEGVGAEVGSRLKRKEKVKTGMLSSTIEYTLETLPFQKFVKRKEEEFTWLREKLIQELPGLYVSGWVIRSRRSPRRTTARRSCRTS